MTVHTPKDWTEFRDRLLARKQELLAEIHAVEEGMEAGSGLGDVMDTKDAARKQENLDVRRAEVQRDETELADVVAALQRMADGSYGECIDCGQEIDVRRLQARPESMRCIACKEKVEAAAHH